MQTLSKLFMLLALFFVACETETKEDTATETTEEVAESKYSLTPFSTSTQYPDAKILDMNYENGKVTIPYEGDAYELGAQTPDAGTKMCANSGKGQHIHFIANDSPYAAHYTNEFDAELPDGEHYILSFLSRSYHESIKTEAAYIAEKVTVEDQSFTTTAPIEEAMLFYSRPKGTYVGKANTERVMLDFFLINADLGDDYRVKIEINDEQEFVVDDWKPYYIEGLPMGDNRVKLTLINAAGEPYDIPLNPVERVFTLKEDPAEQG